MKVGTMTLREVQTRLVLENHLTPAVAGGALGLRMQREGFARVAGDGPARQEDRSGRVLADRRSSRRRLRPTLRGVTLALLASVAGLTGRAGGGPPGRRAATGPRLAGWAALRSAALVAAVAFGTSGGVPGAGPGPLQLASYQAPATAPPVGPFTVAGNVIHNGRGQVFFVHGVDRPSTEWSCTGQAITGQPGVPASDFQTMAKAWKANTVRITLNDAFWLSSLGHKVSPADTCSNYPQTIMTEVNNAEAAGLAVILDLHWSTGGNLANQAAQQPMAGQNAVAFWTSVANTFKSNPGVMFEMYNEPHGVPWSTWQAGGSYTNASGQAYQVAGYQQLIDAIRSTGATNVVIAGGKNWGYNLSGVPAHPLSDPAHNLAYATHPYQDKQSPGTDPAAWESNFGFLTTTAPVIATEFGSLDTGTNTYDSAILDFFSSHGMGYTAWAWWNGGASFPSLVDNANGTCVNGGCVTQSNLQQLASGSVQMTVPGSPASSTATPSGSPGAPAGSSGSSGPAGASGPAPSGCTGSLTAPAVGSAAGPGGNGYWIAGANGSVVACGDAPSYGSAAGHRLVAPIVGIAATPDGKGYWLVASDGGIFSFGDAAFHGSAGAVKLNKPVVGMAATPDGGGYWLVASDGGIFSFGNAAFYGSTGAIKLNKP
ncbi:MAG: glycoside hydrolase family 5 protein, partial [Acidimicrobiales bacterium]